MKKILILFAVLSSSMLQAQLLTADRDFTRADTLRGTLTMERNWFDVNFYDLHITVDPANQMISGYNDIRFKVQRLERTMQLDLFENMEVDSIVMDGKTLKHRREGNAVFIKMAKPLKIGANYNLQFHYHGNPIVAKRAPWDGGIVWSKDDNGKDWIGMACEGTGASLWWPNKDHLTDEPDSMMISVAVPKDIVYIGNGNLRSKEAEGDFMRYNWFVSYPINNYNVTINAGDYVHFDEEYVYADGEVLDLDYYVLSYNLDKAKKHFKQVKPMFEAFEKYLGKYPFMDDGFALVETPYLGMEHQSAIAYGNEYKTGYAGRDYSQIGLDFDYIIIHETGHEWWGNSVSCGDMADLWIHEGFCTYSEAIYVEHLHGKETAIKYINAKRPYIGNKEPIRGQHWGVNEEGDGDMYSKGSLVLNTLRSVIADDKLWWEIIYGLANDFEYQVVDSKDIRRYIEKKSGKDLSKIMDQYLNYADIPVLEYRAKKKRRGTVLSYRWNTQVEGFDMPFSYTDAAGKTHTIQPTSEWQSVRLKKTKRDKIVFGEDYYYVNLKEVE